MHDTIAYDRMLIAALRIFDLLTMIFCFCAAAIVTSSDFHYVDIRSFLEIRLQAENVLVFTLFLILWERILQTSKVYSDLHGLSLRKHARSLALGITFGSVVLAVLLIAFDVSFASLKFIAIFWSGALAIGIASRTLLVFLLERRALRTRNPEEFLVVGVNPRSIRLAGALAADRHIPRKFLGFVDVQNSVHPYQFDCHPHEFITYLDELEDYLRSTPIDEVIVCLPLKSYYDETMRIVDYCEKQGVSVKVLADLFQTRMTHSRIEQLGNQSVISVATHNIRGFPALAKRTIDFVLSGLLLIALSPLMLLSALLILITSPGPVLFSQERVGLNKKIFKVHKFRTMVTDAEVLQAGLENMNEAQGPAFKIHNDPRVTGIGRFLRKSSIDELPQLINVLKGEMSLVGPRPLPLRDYAGFEEDWHRRRLSVKPGITGYWQVKERNHSSFDRWMKLDMLYIDQWSLWLDLKIILLTIPAVLRGSGE